MAYISSTLFLLFVALVSSSFAATIDARDSVANTKLWDSTTGGNGLNGKVGVVLNTRWITGTLFGVGYNTLVTHGVPLNSVLTYSVFVNSTNALYPPGYSYSIGYGFQTFMDSAYIRINPIIGGATYIYGKPFLIYIVYTS